MVHTQCKDTHLLTVATTSSEDAASLAGCARILAVVKAPSKHAAALANSTRILTVVAVPSEHAAALANSTKIFAVVGIPSEHAAALAENRSVLENSEIRCRCRNPQQRILVKSEILHFLNCTNSQERNGAVV